MEYYQHIEDFKSTSSPLVLTIGFFDGLHPGHCKVIERTNHKAETCGGESVVLTFSNHPSVVLTERPKVLPIYTIDHKISLLSELNIDYLIQIPFTKLFSEQSPNTFINTIRKHIPFEHLILGYDAKFGKNREGNRETVLKIGKKSNFSVEYISPVKINNNPVSSSRIRKAIESGDLSEVNTLLNRPYSILSPVISGEQKGRHLGFPTLNIKVSQLCLLPFGVYTVYLKIQNKRFQGVANLGVAPTIKQTNPPVFEVYLFDVPPEILGDYVELFPLKFLRSEIKFPSTQALKKQITNDISVSRQYFESLQSF